MAQPKYIEPNIIIITEKIGIVAGKDTIFSLNEYILVLGPISGLKETILTIIKPYIKADTIPGKNPASKSCPTDSSTIIAYITNIALGGISVANVPPAATTPAASFLL